MTKVQKYDTIIVCKYQHLSFVERFLMFLLLKHILSFENKQ